MPDNDITLQMAAKQARITPAYLRRCLRLGCESYHLAHRLSNIFERPIEDFLYGHQTSDGTLSKTVNNASSPSSGRRQRTRSSKQRKSR